MRRGETALVAAALWTAVALTACASSKPAQRGAAAPKTSHPEVDTGLGTCAGCHAQATSAVTAQWSGSRHGMALVECFICHGSTGQDFRAHPEPTGCQGCHPVQVSSVTRDGRTQGCFQCHPPHALRAQGKTSPHPPRPQGS
jgi:hypothetical protein